MSEAQVAFIPLTNGKTLPAVLVKKSLKNDPTRRTETLRAMGELLGQEVALITDDLQTWITDGPNARRIVRSVNPRMLAWRRLRF